MTRAVSTVSGPLGATLRAHPLVPPPLESDDYHFYYQSIGAQ